MIEDDYNDLYNDQSNYQSKNIGDMGDKLDDMESRLKDLEDYALVMKDGYEGSMKEVEKARKLTWKHFYGLYLKEHPNKSIRQIDEKLIQIGIKNFNKQIEEDNKTIDDVLNSMRGEFPKFNKNDTISFLKDRGLLVFLKDNYDINSAQEFLEHIGVNIDD